MYDLSCHNGKVISATGIHLKVYRQQVTSDIDDGSDSPAFRDVNPTCTYPDDSSPLSCNDGSISTDSTADGHFLLHGKYIVLYLTMIMIWLIVDYPVVILQLKIVCHCSLCK